MTIQPEKNTPAPGYPEKSRWLAAPLAAGVAAAVLGLSACGERATLGEPTQAPTEITVVQVATTELASAAQHTDRAEEANDTTQTSTGTVVPVVQPEEEFLLAGMPAYVPDPTEKLQ